jgi:hypothetical protein
MQQVMELPDEYPSGVTLVYMYVLDICRKGKAIAAKDRGGP